jgi:hypothetical protein
MKPRIYFIAKDVYGNRLYYPNCELSRLMVALANQKSFTERQIKLIREQYHVDLMPYGWNEIEA